MNTPLQAPALMLAMRQAEMLAQWIAPGEFGSFAKLLHRSIDVGAVKVWARCPPPPRDAVENEWQGKWMDGPLHPLQIELARGAAFCFETGWAKWFDQMLMVDLTALASVMDQLASQTPLSLIDETRWSAQEVFAWIAQDTYQPAALAQSEWWDGKPGNSWRALIWRIERKAGTWQQLVDGSAPAAAKVFDALHAALWPIGRLPAFVEREGEWQEATPSLFTGAQFYTWSYSLDLAGDRAVVFPAEAVRAHWLRDSNPKTGGPSPFSDVERREWMKNCQERNRDKAHRLFKANTRFDGTKLEQWRTEWNEVRPAGRGRPRADKS